MASHVVLLRGINVGGRNRISMSDLRGCFEAEGFGTVSTYIQSGNVLLDARGSATELTDRIERMLSASFGYEASVVVRTRAQMRTIVDRAPAGFGADAARYRYDVIFLKQPLTAATAMRSIATREGVDRVWAGRGVLYFARVTAKATQSRLPKLVSTPIYPHVTIRNWNTTTTLRRMMG